jgi:GAF domain-containing protein
VVEANLDLILRRIRDELQAMSFKTDFDVDNKVALFISNMAALSVDLEDMQLTVKAALQSKYIAHFQADYSNLSETIRLLTQNLSTLSALQSKYMSFRILFTNPRTARFMYQAIKHFNVVDEFFRGFIKNAKNENLLVVPLLLHNLSALPAAGSSGLPLLPPMSMATAVHRLTTEEEKEDAEVDTAGTLRERMAAALESAERAEQAISVYFEDLRRKFPRLYLLDRERLADLLSTTDIPTAFMKIRDVIRVTELIYDKADPHMTIGMFAYDTRMNFQLFYAYIMLNVPCHFLVLIKYTHSNLF